MSNKKIIAVITVLLLGAISAFTYINAEDGKKNTNTSKTLTSMEVKPKPAPKAETEAQYVYPKFYRGIYLNVVSARSMKKLKFFVKHAKKSNINTFVLDVQSSKMKKNILPQKNIEFLKAQGIHPIARVVIFPDGLKKWPVSKAYIEDKLAIAESACKAGFREVQFDYIRFSDSNRNRHLKYGQRYAFIEGFIKKAKKRLKKYNVKLAADVFGRIPLNKNDLIGQQMESLDKVIDIICPMAYPSHYTWSKKLQKNPYHTVYITSKRARERTKRAEIVTYIQAFKIRLYGIPYGKYIIDQVKAVKAAKIRGYILWNARQDYKVPFAVLNRYYSKKYAKM